jgi:ABC-type amino acid transport substrate-binding protein
MLDRWIISTALCLALLGEVGPANAEQLKLKKPGVLTACLPRNAGVIAGRRLTGGSGFDFRMAEEVAKRLGLELEPLWFENELDEETDPLKETYAMLSYGLCDMIPGHPRFEGAVGTPLFDRAIMPRWLGMPQETDRHTNLQVDLLVGMVEVRPIAVSAGYMRTQIGIVYQQGTPEPKDPLDRQGRQVAIQEKTLSGMLAKVHAPPADRGAYVNLRPGATFLWEVEKQGIEMALVDVPAFDGFIASNPFTTYRLAEWRHPTLGMDLGIAVLDRNQGLLAAINAALDDINQAGLPHQIAEEEDMTYAAPISAELAGPITMADVRAPL